jgi:glutathione synthase/RimK-type ligase-like ATP-grasp enzyme
LLFNAFWECPGGTLFARQMLFSLQASGKKVFPDFNTCWHFDDKVGQKYLLESIGAPLVPTRVFYDKKDAMDWLDKTTFPKVFKLSGGAGGMNVRLARNKGEARRLIARAFGRGFSRISARAKVPDACKRSRGGAETLARVFKSCKMLFIPKPARARGREKGYVYFQDFMPGNGFDTRVVVVGDKAFALKRMVRKNDFRASGSGNIVHDKAGIDERCVRVAFEVNEKIKAQSIAYDFVFGENNEPLIVEISYGYTAAAYDRCEGYWDREMNWHAGRNFDFCGWMVENLIAGIENEAR